MEDFGDYGDEWMLDRANFGLDLPEMDEFRYEQEQDCLYNEAENDCPLDGDAESALASCGWGTDEDYGYYGEEY